MSGDALLPAEQRRVLGQALRRTVPRSAHSVWQAPPGRPDPVAVLQVADAGRLAALLPVRYARMRADPFAFLRGAAAVMAADLAAMAATGLRVQACGDSHLMNFGTHATPEGLPVFDVIDFDETLPAPFEWDVKRLGASLAVAGLSRGLEVKHAAALARRAAAAYRQHIDMLSRMAPLAAWSTQIDLARSVDEIGDRAVRRRERQAVAAWTAASRDTGAGLVVDGQLSLPERPPVVFRLGDHEPIAHAAFAAFAEALPEERRVLVERYRLRDVAFKAVGVGSVGTFCALGLFATADGEVLILQAKEAVQSVLEPFAGPSAYPDHGQRVVTGQRLMQATPDPLLGWATEHPHGRHFYVRQLKDSRLANIGVQMETDALRFYASLCGRTLARAHARSGDAARVAGYLGEGEAFPAAIGQFAVAYARQTASDHAAFCEAIQEGRLPVAERP